MFDTAELKVTGAGLAKPESNLRHIAMIGNFPPRRCGIATFSADLYEALARADPRIRCDVAAMNDRGYRYEYGDAVSLQIAQDDAAGYVSAADQLNRRHVELVSIQHEFGIFGGAAGAYMLSLAAGVDAPVVATLHTVLEHPNSGQRRVMDTLIARSTRLVVMSQKGREILMRVYGAPQRKIAVIPHGAPDRPLQATAPMKARLGFGHRDVILTFGLLSPNKGIESVIRALPRIAAERPDALYVVVGATHPHLVAQQGETYRESLMALAEALGVSGNVKFVNKFVETHELLDYLTAADVYVTPYLNKAQITSGTLAYALALGKPVVSTPYWHAEELLADGVGALTPFNDSGAIANIVTQLLHDDVLRRKQAKRAYDRARETIWSRAGERYLEVFEDARAEWLTARAAQAQRRTRHLPSMSLRAIERMTDSTGMLQHGRFATPDRHHGYCVDDNARALMLTQRLAAAGLGGVHLSRLASIYAAFVEHAWNDATQRFRNFMSFDRRWLENAGSEDSFGRALWAVGETALRATDEDLRDWALHLAARAAPYARELESLRAQAFNALGLIALAEAGADYARDTACRLLATIRDAYKKERRNGWRWFEPVLGYDNARLPQALIRGGIVFEDTSFREAGLETLSWLTQVQTAPSGRFRPVGHESFGRAYEQPAQFDQQPLEAAATIDACWAAFDASGDQRWRLEAHRTFAWFFGENDLGLMIADVERGGCFDGLSAAGVNRNQGAESILSYQLSLCSMRVRERPRRAGLAF
jgi:glycosyltransferase involved in cell wall biosynthesis